MVSNMKGGPKNSEFIYKKIVYLFLHVQTSAAFKALSIGCNTPIKMFFLLLKTVFELIDFDAF